MVPDVTDALPALKPFQMCQKHAKFDYYLCFCQNDSGKSNYCIGFYTFLIFIICSETEVRELLDLTKYYCNSLHYVRRISFRDNKVLVKFPINLTY